MLAKLAPKAGLVIRLPFVVLVELARGGADEIERHAEAIGRAARAYKQIALDAPTWPHPDRKTATQAIEKAIHDAAKGANFGTLNVPSVDHEDLLRREFYYGKPFKADGTGYRDALIWHTVLEYAEDEEPETIYFVTANKWDFAGNDGALDPVLAAEAEKAGGRIVLVKDVHALIRDHIASMLKTVDQALGKSIKDVFPNAAAAIDKKLNEHLDGVTTLGELGDEAPDDEIIERGTPELREITWARELENGSILVETKARMHIVGRYDVGERGPPIYEHESGTITFTIQAVVDKNGELASAQILPLRERDTDLGELEELERINLFSRYEDDEM